MGALYRIHQRLLINSKEGLCIPGGEGMVHTLSMISKDHIGALLATGAISLVQAPDLNTFDGWEGKARMLGELGIDTVGFVSLTARDVAYAIRAAHRKEDESAVDFDHKVDKLAVAVERWQHEIRDLLGIGSAYVRR